MKTFTIILVVVICFITGLYAQAPEQFNYQAVLRDASGNLKVNQNVTIVINVLQGSSSGASVFAETHVISTNAQGVVNLNIGSKLEGLGSLDWANKTYFIKVTVDGIEMGTSQLLSVPYALYALRAGNGFSGSYNDLTNKPSLFDGTWSGLTGKPTSLLGYNISDAMSTSHIANAITASNMTNWNTAYGWGNHTGLYRPITYSPSWGEITSKPTFASVATTGNFDDLSNKPTQITEVNVEGFIANDIAINYVPRNNGTKLVSGIIFDNGTRVGIGTNTPAGALDITSSSSGFIMPRMTTVQRIAIVSPVIGMQVFDTDLKGYYYYNGTKWDCSTLPAGTVIYFAGSTPPSGFLECDGQQIFRSQYPELFAAIGIIFGQGDGSNTTFNLPDLRGEFIRGWDHSRGLDKNRIFASPQSDQLQGHKHTDAGHTHTDAGHLHSISTTSLTGTAAYASGTNMLRAVTLNSGYGYASISTSTAVLGNPTDAGTGAGTPRYGTETRPRNSALMPCIKY